MYMHILKHVHNYIEENNIGIKQKRKQMIDEKGDPYTRSKFLIERIREKSQRGFMTGIYHS